jgi:histidine decarboxylase
MPQAPAIGREPADPSAVVTAALAVLATQRRTALRSLGYPGDATPALDVEPIAAAALQVLSNHVGDPECAPAIGGNAYETAVIRFMATLAGAKPNAAYGYMTASSTEAIEFGLYQARHRLPTAPVFASTEAHYTIAKITDILRMKLIRIPARADGTMDPDALRRACLLQAAHDRNSGRPRGRGAVLLATIGTTWHGGWDDPVALRRAARPAGDVHVHCDAAAGGPIAALAPSRPPWGFDSGADTINISGHKFLGCPVPCGIALARAELARDWPTPDYLPVRDRTLRCSRSGLAALLLGANLQLLGTTGLQELVTSCLDTAAYAEERLRAIHYHPKRCQDSITVVFDRPSPRVITTWNLSVRDRQAHIVTMGHVTRDHIDQLTADLAADRTRPPRATTHHHRPQREQTS